MTLRSNETTHTRIRKSLLDKIKHKFPNVPIYEVLDSAYEYSLVNVEGWLRSNKFIEKLKKGPKKKNIW